MAKSKIFESGRDMVLSLVVIIAMMVAGVGFTGLCSFNPGAPENGPVPKVDAHAFLEMEAKSARYPIRSPQLPEGWTPNSARRAPVGDAFGAVVGVVTDQESYLQLMQTGAPEDPAVRDFDEYLREQDRTVDVAGKQVHVYEPVNHEDGVRALWVLDLGKARAMVTGAATDEEHERLLDAVAKAPELPHN